MTTQELKDKQSALITRCNEIVDLCKSEVREMTEDEEKEFNAAKEEIKALKDSMKALEDKLTEYEKNLPTEDKEEKSDEDDKEEDESNKEDKEEKETKEETDKNEEEDSDKDSSEKENKNNRNIEMNTQKFKLMTELRNSLETGKSFNLNEVREYTVTTEGEDVVQTDIYDIWSPLRAKNVLLQAGAQYISGIKNNVQIPLMSAVSCKFAGETEDASVGSGSFTSKVLSPKRITAKYPISLQLLAQDSIGIEAKIREDISKAVSSKLEATLLGDAAGSETKPAGLFYDTSVNIVENFGDITELESLVEAENFGGEMKYIVSPSAKADLRAMAKSSKSTQLVMENGEIDGTPVFATSHVGDKFMAYGDWSNLVIATWDNVQIDVVRDVASVGNGQVTIVVNAFVDAALVRPEGIVFGTTDSSYGG